MNTLTQFLKNNAEPPVPGRRDDRAWQIALLALLALYCAAFTVINFWGLTEYMDSDIYSDTIIAKYMWDQKTLFPDGWVFGNQYYIIATPVLAALFYGLSGSINIGMACATTVMTAAVLAALYWVLRPFGSRTFALAGVTALVSGILAMDLDIKTEAQLLFVLASYYSCYLLTLLIVWGDYVHCIFLERKRAGFPFFFGLLLSFATGMQSLRQTCVMIAPLLVLECLRVLAAFYGKKKVDWRPAARVTAVTAANLGGVLCIRLLHVPAVHIYGEMSIVHPGELVDRFLQIAKAGTRMTGLWYAASYAGEDNILALFVLAFNLLTITAVAAACWRTAVRLYRRKIGAVEILICLCVLSLAAVCASMLLFQMTVRSVYLFVWHLLLCLSAVSLLPADGQRGKRLALLLLCAVSAANLYFSYKGNLRRTLDPEFHCNPPYYTDMADELVSQGFEILYGQAAYACDICGLTDGKVISCPWWDTPFVSLNYITPQDLHDAEDNERAAYLILDTQLEDILRLAEERGARLTLLRQFDTMGLYTSSIQLMR